VSPANTPASGAGLREKLEWLMLFRLVLVTFLLGSAVVVNVNDVVSFGDPSYIAIVSLIVGTYVATLVYAFWLRRRGAEEQLAYAQLAGDGVLAAGLVLLTGGIHSIFTFLFFLAIFSGAVLLGRRGAMFAASCGSLGLAGIVILQFGDFEFVWRLIPDSVPRTGRVPIYALIIHLVGFYTVAALSGYLAEKLGQVGNELERRRLDIRELRALNDNIVRSLASGLITIDVEGRTIFFNAAAESLTGFKFSDLSMRPLVEGIPGLKPVVEAAGAVADLVPRPRFEQQIIRPDGREIFLGISISSLRSASGDVTGHILIFQDVTELKTMRAAILRQEHLSAIGKLSAAIAHEIRNPLAAISGSIEMLRMLLDPPEDERKLMEIVIREVDRLNTLIEDFLDYARPGKSRRISVETHELVGEIVRIFERDPTLGTNIAVKLDDSIGPETHERIYVDPAQMHQVLWNLLRNASEAMHDGGTITVRQSTHHDLRTDQNYVSLIVEDEGEGLPDEVLPNLFEPFFTTKSNGTGLGLATCHRIVVAHKGQLSGSNRPEGGASFVLSIPVDDSVQSRVPSDSVDALSELIDSTSLRALESGVSQIVS
jgi:two-component system sensor histidine kinase PilS (NtrC family)